MNVLLPAIALIATSTAAQEPPTRVNGPYGPEVVNHLALGDAPEGRLRPLRTHRGESWADPTRVHFIGRGLVALLDPTVSRMHRIRSDGSELESIGRAGKGPGEWPRGGQALLDGDEVDEAAVAVTGLPDHVTDASRGLETPERVGDGRVR